MFHLFAANCIYAGYRVHFIGMFLEIFPFIMREIEKEEGAEEIIEDEVWNFEYGAGGEYVYIIRKIRLKTKIMGLVSD